MDCETENVDNERVFSFHWLIFLAKGCLESRTTKFTEHKAWPYNEIKRAEKVQYACSDPLFSAGWATDSRLNISDVV